MEITMWLLKLHDYNEFDDFKISEDIALLKKHIEEQYEREVKIVQCSNSYQVIIDEEEVGFIGPVEKIVV